LSTTPTNLAFLAEANTFKQTFLRNPPSFI
jgi:hypothetical protein